MLVEYGASDEAKAEYLLRARNRRARVPRLCPDRRRGAAARADARAAAPAAAGSARVCRAGRLHGRGGAADGGAALPRLGFFPGSTIGNLDPAGGAAVPAARARRRSGVESSFLVGVDLRKDPAILLPAYDDAAGRDGGVQSQPAGPAQSRGRRRFRPGRRSPIAPSGTTQRAGSRCTWSACATRRCASPARSIRFAARRDDPHREQLQVRAGAFRGAGRKRPDGTPRSCGPTRRRLFSLHLLEPTDAAP